MTTKTSGFVYIWRDRKHNRYYIGSHWGSEDDGYICSSSWMKQAYKKRPEDFRRRILSRVYTNKKDLLVEEQRWFDLIDPKEVGTRYYNIRLSTYNIWHSNDNDLTMSIAQKISRANKGKNTGPRNPLVGEKISKVKREKFKQKQELFGYKFSEEHRKKMSDVRTGISQTEESNRKRSETLLRKYESGELTQSSKGKHISDTHKAAISLALKGKPLTKETCEKLSESNKKEYIIKLFGSEPFKIRGLENWCKENNIPIVTASVASRKNTSIKKYGIEYIKRL